MTVATGTLEERFTVRLTRWDRALMESASDRRGECTSEFARRVLVAASATVLTEKVDRE